MGQSKGGRTRSVGQTPVQWSQLPCRTHWLQKPTGSVEEGGHGGTDTGSVESAAVPCALAAGAYRVNRGGRTRWPGG